jgi:hypothetical protein
MGVRLTFSAFAASGTCACGMNIFGPGSLLRPPSRLSATTPMICRSGSSLNSRMTVRPITRRSSSGSPLGQYCRAIASLMITTAGPVLLSRSLNDRPRLIGILNTSKYPGEIVIQLPPPWKGPSVSGRPMMVNGSP